MQDQFGNAATRAGAVSVTPSSSSTGANKAFKTTGGTTASSFSIAAGQSSVSFLYYDELAGSFSITTTNNASSPTLANPSTLTFTVSPAVASKVIFGQQPTNATAGVAIS